MHDRAASGAAIILEGEMESEHAPVPETSGALLPPTRHPPTALAVATPPPPRRPRSPLERFQADPRTRRLVDNAIEFVFDRADAIGDGIASLFGLRPKPPAVPTRSDAVD